jgi:hypothetical protein
MVMKYSPWLLVPEELVSAVYAQVKPKLTSIGIIDVSANTGKYPVSIESKNFCYIFINVNVENKETAQAVYNALSEMLTIAYRGNKDLHAAFDRYASKLEKDGRVKNKIGIVESKEAFEIRRPPLTLNRMFDRLASGREVIDLTNDDALGAESGALSSAAPAPHRLASAGTDSVGARFAPDSSGMISKSDVPVAAASLAGLASAAGGARFVPAGSMLKASSDGVGRGEVASGAVTAAARSISAASFAAVGSGAGFVPADSMLKGGSSAVGSSIMVPRGFEGAMMPPLPVSTGFGPMIGRSSVGSLGGRFVPAGSMPKASSDGVGSVEVAPRAVTAAARSIPAASFAAVGSGGGFAPAGSLLKPGSDGVGSVEVAPSAVTAAARSISAANFTAVGSGGGFVSAASMLKGGSSAVGSPIMVPRGFEGAVPPLPASTGFGPMIGRSSVGSLGGRFVPAGSMPKASSDGVGSVEVAPHAVTAAARPISAASFAAMGSGSGFVSARSILKGRSSAVGGSIMAPSGLEGAAVPPLPISTGFGPMIGRSSAGSLGGRFVPAGSSVVDRVESVASAAAPIIARALSMASDGVSSGSSSQGTGYGADTESDGAGSAKSRVSSMSSRVSTGEVMPVARAALNPSWVAYVEGRRAASPAAERAVDAENDDKGITGTKRREPFSGGKPIPDAVREPRIEGNLLSPSRRINQSSLDPFGR